MSFRRAGKRCAFLAILALATTLRLWDLRGVAGNSFYDAAVRSMSSSWHNLFFGALEPSGSVSIDKPPLDLWLQVATTKVLGSNLIACICPRRLPASRASGCYLGPCANRSAPPRRCWAHSRSPRSPSRC